MIMLAMVMLSFLAFVMTLVGMAKVSSVSSRCNAIGVALVCVWVQLEAMFITAVLCVGSFGW